jgi:hypothetical protein
MRWESWTHVMISSVCRRARRGLLAEKQSRGEVTCYIWMSRRGIVYEADCGWVKSLTSSEAKGCHVMVQVWVGKLVSYTTASICSSFVLACTACQTFDIEWAVIMIWWRRFKVNRTLIQARLLVSPSSTTEVCQYSVIIWTTNVQNCNYLISIICTVHYRPSLFAGA